MTKDDYSLRLLNNERRKNEVLIEENESLRDEIGRLNDQSRDLSLNIRKLLEK